MRTLLLAALLALPAAASAQQASTAAARPIDLDEAFRLSLERSEDLVRRGAQHDELVARIREVWAAVLPTVTLRGTETLQHVPSGSTGLFLQRHREQAWLNGRQALFSGFREFLAKRALTDQSEAARLGVERAKQLLYRDVARAYLDLLEAQDEIRIRDAVTGITEDRVRDLRQRLGVGRSRRSELLAAESQLAQARAQLESARALERTAQFQLRFLTGLDEDLAPRPLPPAAGLPPLESVLALARARPDVEAARLEASAAETSVTATSRRRWPTASADANWYLKRPPSFTDRVKWDVVLSADLPLFSGGATTAQVRQQEARVRAAKASLDEAARRAALEARTAHEDLRARAAVVAALERAAKAADANADAQAADYRLGMSTNQDVLGALSALQEARLGHARALLDEWWARVRLETAAGRPGGALR